MNRPPYHIAVSGEKNDYGFAISITDNGPGFDDDALQNLGSKIAEIESTKMLPSLEISGMGLLNVFIRFKLLHGDNAIFHLENTLPHGAQVTIGVSSARTGGGYYYENE